ncbi:MAG: beta/gamma crystallin family protein, partial [Casimicrobiaceae bacterium]
PRAPRAILYSDHDFGGRSVVIDGDLPNLDGSGFNDRAASIRVEGGFWQFCTDAGYRGDCRSFGPGEYANLPDEFEARISSVRRVAAPR